MLLFTFIDNCYSGRLTPWRTKILQLTTPFPYLCLSSPLCYSPLPSFSLFSFHINWPIFLFSSFSYSFFLWSSPHFPFFSVLFLSLCLLSSFLNTLFSFLNYISLFYFSLLSSFISFLIFSNFLSILFVLYFYFYLLYISFVVVINEFNFLLFPLLLIDFLFLILLSIFPVFFVLLSFSHGPLTYSLFWVNANNLHS